MHRTVPVALVFLLALAGSAYADRVALSPTADASVYSYVPTQNTGNATRMEVGCWWVTGVRYEYRSYVQFDLSSIPSGSEIDACTLYVKGYYYQSPAGDYTASRATASWTEGGLNWNNQPPITDTNQATITISGQGWRKFDLTGMGRRWLGGTPNYGLCLWKNTPTDSNARTYFNTRNASDTVRESLWVVYTPPGSAHITDIVQAPSYPVSTENIGVSARIWLGSGTIDSAAISYSNDRATWTYARSDSSRAGDSTWFFHIPPRTAGDSCHYRLHVWSGAVQTNSGVNSLKIPWNVSIHNLQRCDTLVSERSPWADSFVHTTGIVTGVLTTYKCYLGTAAGDTWSGAVINHGGVISPPLSVGDSIDIVCRDTEY